MNKITENMTPEKTINRLKRLQLEDFMGIHHFKNEKVKSHLKYLAGIQKYQKGGNNYIVALRLACLEDLEKAGYDRKISIKKCKTQYPFN